ncbi:MAG: DUF2892 domain-containing protein [Gammaproteobacteria bacterium]|nr:DUF2892 domain-containing protein [Gammaproteobacteria bacterium]
MMEEIAHRLGVVQNIGLLDRLTRIAAGCVMLALPAYDLISNDAMVTWQAYVALLAIYPLMTGILGWDPLYSAAHVRTCGVSSRNRCGTVPYQVDAALGHDPIADHDYDHSLMGSHHRPH